VALTVISQQTFTASPTTLSFSYIVGLAVPPAQTFQLSSSGGTAPFSATTPSSVSWLQASPASGSTPATLSVSVNPQGLAAGNYTAIVTINSPYSPAVAAGSVTVNLAVTQITVKPGNITNAASYTAGVVAPGENIVIWGTSIGPATLTYGALTASGGALSTIAGNTRVLFDGVSSAGGVRARHPDQRDGAVRGGRPAHHQHRRGVSGVQSTPLIYSVQAAVPGIYTQNQQGFGPGAILNQNGVTVNGLGTSAAKGSVVSVYMTGEGQTSPGARPRHRADQRLGALETNRC